MMRPRDIRRLRRAAAGVIDAVMHPLVEVCQANPPGRSAGPHNRNPAKASPAQMNAAEALREEHDLLHLGIPSDAELWRVMDAAR